MNDYENEDENDNNNDIDNNILVTMSSKKTYNIVFFKDILFCNILECVEGHHSLGSGPDLSK